MALMMMSFLSFTAALILDSVARSRAEQLRIHYLTLPALNTSRGATEAQDAPEKPKRERSSKVTGKGESSRAA